MHNNKSLILLAGLLLATGFALQARPQKLSTIPQEKIAIGVFTLQGEITIGDQLNVWLEQLNKAMNPELKLQALLVILNTPGGAFEATFKLAEHMEKCKKSFPVIAFVQQVGMSCGYYLAAMSSMLIATPLAIVGSIGVLWTEQKKTNELLKDQNTILTYIDNFSIHHANNTAENIRENKDAGCDLVGTALYERFIDHITFYRPQLASLCPTIWAEGKVFTGRQAYNLGLVDALGSYSDVFDSILNYVRARKPEAVLDDLEFISLS